MARNTIATGNTHEETRNCQVDVVLPTALDPSLAKDSGMTWVVGSNSHPLKNLKSLIQRCDPRLDSCCLWLFEFFS